jgi:hypothetical protein
MAGTKGFLKSENNLSACVHQKRVKVTRKISQTELINPARPKNNGNRKKSASMLL